MKMEIKLKKQNLQKEKDTVDQFYIEMEKDLWGIIMKIHYFINIDKKEIKINLKQLMSFMIMEI